MSSIIPKTITQKIGDKFNFEPRVIELMRIVMLPKALRPNKATILTRTGLSEPMYYYWLRHPRFNEARREFVKQYYKDDIPDVLMALKDEAVSGNPIAAKLFLEYVDDFNRDPANQDPDEKPAVNRSEVRIIINKLTQKFYGNEKPELRPVEGEAQYEVRGSALPVEGEADSLSKQVDGDLRDQNSQIGE